MMPLLTSHVYVLAAQFIASWKSIPVAVKHQQQQHPGTCGWPSAPVPAQTRPVKAHLVLMLCTRRMRDAFIPLFICTCKRNMAPESFFFLTCDAVRPPTMRYVFRLLLIAPVDAQAQQLLGRRLQVLFPYLTRLTLHCYNGRWSLPESLRDITLIDIAEANWGAVVSKLATLPRLTDLRLNAVMEEPGPAVAALFKPSSALRSKEIFFPRLLLLSVQLKQPTDWNPRPLNIVSFYEQAFLCPFFVQLSDFGLGVTYTRLARQATICAPHFLHATKLDSLLDRFLSNSAIASVDLSDLRVTAVGSFFLSNTLITDIDMAPLGSLRRIGDDFLRDCAHLTQIKAWPPHLEVLGAGALCKCTALEDLNLGGLPPSLRYINTGHFAEECMSLEKVNTAPLRGKVGSRVQGCFLDKCTALTEIDLSGLEGVVSIGGQFLRDAENLKAVHGTQALRRVTVIGDDFLYRALQLEIFDFSDLAAVQEVGMKFLSGCMKERPAGTELDLRGMAALKTVGEGFCQSSAPHLPPAHLGDELLRQLHALTEKSTKDKNEYEKHVAALEARLKSLESAAAAAASSSSCNNQGGPEVR